MGNTVGRFVEDAGQAVVQDKRVSLLFSALRLRCHVHAVLVENSFVKKIHKLENSLIFANKKLPFEENHRK